MKRLKTQPGVRGEGASRTSPLMDEPPLLIFPTLAAAIGLNEAIVLQQLHYWLCKSTHIQEGKRWVFNSVEQWRKQFPFFSLMTLRRVFKNLENQGIIIQGCFNTKRYDKTKWHTVDYDRLLKMNIGFPKASTQIEHMDVFKLNKPIPETTQRENKLHTAIFSLVRETLPAVTPGDTLYPIAGKFMKELGEKELLKILTSCITREMRFENEHKLAAYLTACKNNTSPAKKNEPFIDTVHNDPKFIEWLKKRNHNEEQPNSNN